MEPQKSSIGSIVGTIIIIAIIILGGLYFWGKRIEESKATERLVTETPKFSASELEAATIKSTSPSDDLNSIQTDLNSTNLDNLTPELK